MNASHFRNIQVLGRKIMDPRGVEICTCRDHIVAGTVAEILRRAAEAPVGAVTETKAKTQTTAAKPRRTKQGKN